MKKIIRANLFILLLLFTLIVPVRALVTVRSVISDRIHVVFDFKEINVTMYQTLKLEVDETTIPNMIKKNLEDKDLTRVNFEPEPHFFDDSSRRITLAFYISGLDILKPDVDTKSMIITYHVETDWRKFQINLTNGLKLDFTEYFNAPVDQWQRINYSIDGSVHSAFYHNFADQNDLDAKFNFVLPSGASNIEAVADTIIFELPLPFEDSLLNSPFLILFTLIVVVIAISLYRKVRK